jgi:hypothetical protein
MEIYGECEDLVKFLKETNKLNFTKNLLILYS